MTTVMVSGCFDLLHAGHVRFLEDARALGDKLVVSVAGDASLAQHKGRLSAMPVGHKAEVFAALSCVDRVVIAEEARTPGMDFVAWGEAIRPDVLAVTEDDAYGDRKLVWCSEHGVRYVVLPKHPPVTGLDPISTTEIRDRCAAPEWVPVRIDIAGGWLDVPKLAVPGGLIVNLAVTPGMSLDANPWKHGGGVGGSAAWHLLNGRNPIEAELDAGVGWQDPAVIEETGLCVWESGDRPKLVSRSSGEFLRGLLAVEWTGQPHATPDLIDRERDYDEIGYAATTAAAAVQSRCHKIIAHGIAYSYAAQLDEGMDELPRRGELARKYLGSGHGGYGLYLFDTQKDRVRALAKHASMIAIEPYDRWSDAEGDSA